MPVNLPTGWVIALNVAGWPLIHLGIGWIFTRLPQRLFTIQTRYSTNHRRERSLYILIGIRRWKRLLPDAAPWLGGLPKRRPPRHDRAALLSFAAETRRGEAAHWAMLAAAPLFCLWNPLWADAVMFAYAIAANIPCIAVQRYNRLRLAKSMAG